MRCGSSDVIFPLDEIARGSRVAAVYRVMGEDQIEFIELASRAKSQDNFKSVPRVEGHPLRESLSQFWEKGHICVCFHSPRRPPTGRPHYIRLHTSQLAVLVLLAFKASQSETVSVSLASAVERFSCVDREWLCQCPFYEESPTY